MNDTVLIYLITSSDNGEKKKLKSNNYVALQKNEIFIKYEIVHVIDTITHSSINPS